MTRLAAYLLISLSVTLLSLLHPSTVSCDHWALLVAGSDTWTNYRHQADVCHAYHIVRNHGIPEDRIIVMMYDDIANNTQNPIKGSIINKPNGPNLYPGVVVDYTDFDVTADNFLKILTGDKAGIKNSTKKGGKVIESGPEDTIFVYFSDHGYTGILSFPDTELYAKDLNTAILRMHTNKRFKKMVLYVEACDAGSMFYDILGDDIGVYAMTASKRDELSDATYWDDKRETFLGDVFSVNWMENSDVANLNKETLKEQYELVKNKTRTSHVMEYGDLSMRDLFLGQFQGNETRTNYSKPTSSIQKSRDESESFHETIPSYLVPIETLRRRAATAAKGERKVEMEKEYKRLLKRNTETDLFFQNMVKFMPGLQLSYQQLFEADVKITDDACYRFGIRTIKAFCPGMMLNRNDFALRNLRVLANMCEREDIPQEKIRKVVENIAGKSPIC